MIHETSDLFKEIRQNRLASFEQDYGVDPASVLSMFKDGNVINRMLEHMYFDQMELLRQCDIVNEGQGIQAQARLLWTLLNLPKEIKELNEE